MPVYTCVGMTVSIFTLESILRGEGKGVGTTQTEKQNAGVRGHTLTRTLRCVTEGVKINAVRAKLFHSWCRV